MSIIQSNASVTHTYGNVACVAMNYIKKYFTEDFFNVTHISTKLAYKQLDIFKTKQEFWKLHKPMLIMRPRIELDDSSKYFYGAAMMNRMHNVRSPMEYANTVELLKDKTRGVNIQFLWNRSKIYYDIVIIVDTLNQQLNLVNYLTNMIVPNTPFPIRTPLESYIPKSVIYPIAEHLGIDRNDTAELLRYLNTYSNVPFTYKFKTGSGNDEFFALYGTNIEAIPSDLSMDDGSERGLITDSYTISFTLSCEFNMMSCFYLSLIDGVDKFIACPPDMDVDTNGRVIPLYTIPLLTQITLDSGWKILNSSVFKVTDRDVDTVDLSKVFDIALQRVVLHQQQMNLPRDLFVKFRVFCDDTELISGPDTFEVDTSDLNHVVLRTYHGDPKKTYRLLIIVNNAYIHSITTEINQFDKNT